MILLVPALVLAGLCFAGIVRGYRRLGGVPWLPSLGFAAASVAAMAALRALLAP